MNATGSGQSRSHFRVLMPLVLRLLKKGALDRRPKARGQ
jgi:hypothetical protein